MYGLIATAAGYSYPAIDDMELPDAIELFNYWSEHPPVHLMVAAYLGVKSQSPKLKQDEQDSAVSQFIGLLGMGNQIAIDPSANKALFSPRSTE